MIPIPISRVTAAGLCAAIALSADPAARAEDSLIGCNRDAMLVFDASGSMASMGYNGLEAPRILEAREALRATLPSVTPFRKLGLVVYGPGQGDACSNVDMRLPPIPNAAAAILSEVDDTEPEGETPLTKAVETAAGVFADGEPGIVVLVTDGRETCGGSPCALADRLVESGADLTVHVIAFKVRGDTFDPATFGVRGFERGGDTAARCLSDRTHGLYVSTETTDELIDALRQTLGCALLSDATGRRSPDRS